MRKEVVYNYLATWVDSLLAKGKYGFALSDLKVANPELSDASLKLALNRHVTKRKIISIFKGYYLILPPQYAAKGILPPQLFMDAFMKHLQRPYYVSLLNAAAYHGAAHQPPQEYFVMTNFPVLRPTNKRGLKINYVSIRDIPNNLLEQRKTEAGYLTISNAALTACDLIQFEKRIGGINRAATVISELTEVIQPSDFNSALLRHTHITALQRLGYMIEYLGIHMALANALYAAMKREQIALYRIPLKPSAPTKGFSSDNRWNVIINKKIEADE